MTEDEKTTHAIVALIRKRDDLQAENAKMVQALGQCAIALGCMSGLSSRNENHRESALEIIKKAIGD